MRKIGAVVNKIKEWMIIIISAYFSIMYCSYDFYTILNRYALYVTFFIMFVLFILEFKNIFQKKRNSLIISLIIIAIVFFTIVVNSSGYGSLAILMILLFAILCSNILNISKSTIKISSFIILMGQIIFLKKKKKYYNTNTYGYISFAMLPFSLAFLIGDKKVSRRRQIIGLILSIPLIILTVEVILESQSRGALLGFIVFIAFMMLSNKYIKNSKLYGFITVIILVSIIGFVLLYVSMWENNVNFSIPFTEKSLYSGREGIWAELLKQFSDNYMLGVGSHYNIQSFETLNVHNSMLYILVIYGSIVFILFWILLYNTIRNNNKYIENNRYNKIFLSAILGMLIVSFFETNLEWTDVNIYFILSLIYCYSIKDNRKDLMENEERKIQRIS